MKIGENGQSKPTAWRRMGYQIVQSNTVHKLQFSGESRLSRLFKSMTEVALSGSCNSPIQGEKRDLSRVSYPESCFLIILTRVKILVVFFTIAGQKIIKALT
jgi:hypothetical protein